VFSPIETSRLRLRPFTAQDGALLHRLMSDRKVFFWLDAPVSRQDADALLTSKIDDIGGGLGWWPVFLKSAENETSGFLGQVCVQPLPGSESIELGYHFLSNTWGHGYATEAAFALLDLFFASMDRVHISAVVLPDNTRSLKVVRKLGFELCGTRLHGKKRWPHHYFELTRRKFLAQGNSAADISAFSGE